jgi:nicotinamide-nucleotide amidase
VNKETLLITLQQKMQNQQAKLALAESCTGGKIASEITNLAGCSQWFDRAYITYSNQAKTDLLSVKTTTLDKYGAVSKEVAQEMVMGCLKKSACDYALSVTGIAGPGGGSATKPVGTVWFSWAKYKNKEIEQNTYKSTIENSHIQVKSLMQKFDGDRLEIREKAVNFALSQLLDFMS